MKDSKFIELLNLYVDHQISATDAALLEAEIQRDAERRRIYRQYCQMQKACVMLADSFRTEAPVSGKIVSFAPARRRLRAVAYGIGAAAVAACVALVMGGRQQSGSHAAAPAVAGVTAQPAVAPQSTPALAPARVALQPVFAGVLRDSNATDLSLGGSERVPLDWMTRVQLDRVPGTKPLWFETRPTIQPQDLSFPSRPSSPTQVEMTAFRFQK